MKGRIGTGVGLLVLVFVLAPVVHPLLAQEPVPVERQADDAIVTEAREALAEAGRAIAEADRIARAQERLEAGLRELKFIALVVQTVVHQLLEADRPEAAARLLAWACVEDTLDQCLTSDDPFKMNSVAFQNINEATRQPNASATANMIATIVAIIESRVGIDLDIVDLAPLFSNAG